MNILLRVLGVVFVLVGIAGVVLPILPTTPFILLAAACFIRSSPRLHAILASSRTFGPMIRTWDARRCISPRVKVVAITMIVVCGGCSVGFLLEEIWLRIIGAILIAIGLVAVSMLKTCSGDEM